MSGSLSEIFDGLGIMTEAEKADIEKDANEVCGDMTWLPTLGPQLDAYFCPADVLLYGGQGGGGKTDLGLGLAFTAHQRSLLMRRMYANLGGLTERAIEINGGRTGFNGSPPPLLRTGDGRYIQFGANQRLGDEQAWQGQPFDLKYFDEACQFLEIQIRFHLGWLRSTKPGQRTRMVLGSNPPLDATGDWLIKMFRPWLDITHHRPAQQSELRYFATGDDGIDIEVDEDDVVIDNMGRKLTEAFHDRAGQPLKVLSRTFIPASLADNPYLVNTDYGAKLDSLPEPIRSAVRDGNFMAARQDANFQVIPTQWIIEAQARWKPDGWKEFAMTAMAIDPAGGGNDAQEIAYRHGPWFGPINTTQGVITKDGSASAAAIIKLRRDNAPVIVDVGGGYGGAVCERLKDNQIDHTHFNGAIPTGQKTKDRTLGFFNLRSEAAWRLREALDPDQEGGSPIAIPPEPEILSDLSALTFTVGPRGIQVGPKEKLRDDLGRSPGKGDAIIMCHACAGTLVRKAQRSGGFGGIDRPKFANVAYSSLKARRRK